MQPSDSTNPLSAQTRRTFLGSLAGGAAAFSLGGIALSEMLAREARKWQSTIELVSKSQRVDGKSILEVLTLAAEEGTKLVVEASGPDAAEALSAIVRLFDSNFHENDETAVGTAGRTTTP